MNKPMFYHREGVVFCGGPLPVPGIRLSNADARALLGQYTDELRAALEAQHTESVLHVARAARELIQARCEARQWASLFQHPK